MPIILLSLMAACATSFAALIVFGAQKVRHQTLRICCPFSVYDPNQGYSAGEALTVFEPVTVAIHLEDVNVVGEAIEQCAG